MELHSLSVAMCCPASSCRLHKGSSLSPRASWRRRPIKAKACHGSHDSSGNLSRPDREELDRRRQITETALQEQLTTAAEQVVAAEAKVRAGAAAIAAAAAVAKVARQENKDADAIDDLERAVDIAARATLKVANAVQAAKARIEVAADVSLSPDLDTISQEIRRIKDLHTHET